MTDRADVWRAAARLAAGSEVGAIATVCRHRGSLPMARDAKMVVTESGRRWGTIGGGCIEADVTEQALAAARAGRPAIQRHTLNADVAGDLGLSCGGTVELFLEPIVRSAEAERLLDAVADAIEQRVPAVVGTALDWIAGPRKLARVGETVWFVGGSGDGDAGVGRPAPPHHGEVPLTTPFFNEPLGLFVEPIPRLPRVIVFGAGHVGCEIARIAAGAGFYVVLADDRAEFASRDRAPWAHEVLAGDFRLLLDRLVLDGDDYVLAATRGHGFDAYIVERTAASRARYVGMLGSRRKKEVIWSALEESGVPRSALDRVRVPIGEPIGADTPEEIAVSVVAELIRVRRLGNAAEQNSEGVATHRR